MYLEGDYHQFFKKIVKLTLVYDQNIRKSMIELKQIIDKEYNNTDNNFGF